MSDTQVLIVGAGPTGLILALCLRRFGLRVRIIDKTAGPGTTSRALVVHARTLEFYDQLGLAEAVVTRGLKFAAVNLWVRGRKAAHVSLGAIGQGLSPFPYLIIFPQDEHEQLLIDRLAEAGTKVERETELLGFEERGNHVLARLRGPNGIEEACEVAYVAGCDGAHSTVRETLKIGFPGGTYRYLFYVADVDATGPVMDHELHVALDDVDLLAVFPMAGSGRARLIGTVRAEAEARHGAPSWHDVSQRLFERLSIQVKQVNWFSTYHVHHRVADRFQQGRAFLLGDAAHIHSPVGGQGMNTGIGDAVNLAWKLVAVLQERANVSLLHTYEPERIAFARRLVATTDRAFTFVNSPGSLARFVRIKVVPRLLPALVSLSFIRRFMFRTISQIGVNYRCSRLSMGDAGHVKGGDRLPWVATGDGSNGRGDNFAPLRSCDWQVHVYGTCSAGIAELCERRGLALHVFSWRPATADAGIRRGAVYLVRPDGYIGLVDAGANPGALERYLDDQSVQPLNRMDLENA
ncbi:FAD-dependent monooxygenase [Microvirga puerhi]|uniref:FAD-dependent monooxygenase n=1 Tax=Microvirga puerhi TaxID=2876078 RepID=A0ABS7VJ47_9HYPH|nr:FAD-dependent monooxygenase [Microvirga puerhi]MBZ6075120.1 FAD-dependent monooxygenase [Microvirga puerhi]